MLCLLGTGEDEFLGGGTTGGICEAACLISNVGISLSSEHIEPAPLSLSELVEPNEPRDEATLLVGE